MKGWLLAGIGAVVVFLLWQRRQAAVPAAAPAAAPDATSSDTGETDMSVVTQGVKDLAAAIANAEGFGVAGAAPTRAHNPGDLKLGDKGYGLTGTEGVTVFASDVDGWTALYHQIGLIVSGTSREYTLDMTLTAMAEKWTDTQQSPWLSNVVTALQDAGYYIDATSSLGDVLNA